MSGKRYKDNRDAYTVKGYNLIMRKDVNRVLIVMFLSCCLSGCGFMKKIQHLPQLLTLKRYSDGQEKIAQEAKSHNERFDLMIVAARFGELEHYTKISEVYKKFGKPVFVRTVNYKGRDLEQNLYRSIKGTVASQDKIYFYVDGKGMIVDRVYEWMSDTNS